MTENRVSCPTVIVVGGDVVVGQALELLLQSTDYRVQFLNEYSPEAPELLGGPQLLILSPGLGDENREALITAVSGEAATKHMSILELAAGARASRVGERHFLVPWPCEPEGLKRQIKTILLAGSEGNKPCTSSRAPNEESVDGV